MFNAQEIHARLSEKPFIPLRVFASSGQSYDITHPELVIVGVRALYIGVPSNDFPQFAETASRVAMLHITDLQELPQTMATGANGSI